MTIYGYMSSTLHSITSLNFTVLVKCDCAVYGTLPQYTTLQRLANVLIAVANAGIFSYPFVAISAISSKIRRGL
jgi:hypothetical protein